jgi:hypothetical protein
MREALPFHSIYAFRVENMNYIYTRNPKAIYMKKYNYQCMLSTKPSEEKCRQEGEGNEKQDEEGKTGTPCEVCGQQGDGKFLIFRSPEM